VQAPVLLVAGSETGFDMAKDWIDTATGSLPYPQAQSCSIAGAGHMVHFEQPEALAAAIEAFVLQYL